jgi:hypothetical protein
MTDKIDIRQVKSLVSSGNLNELESLMLKEKQVDCPVIHRFSPGIYIREVFIPADTFAIGHKQKTEHLNVFLTGKVTMLNEDGSTTELIAPMIFTGQPGRKCGYISEDTVWLNIYNTEEKDVQKLEDMYLDKNPLPEGYIKKVNRSIDNQDYLKVLEEYGFDEKTVRTQSENKDDQTDFPDGGYKVAVMESDIEGKGLFATAGICPDEIIAIARLGVLRTPAGVYTNHSISPNAKMVMVENDIFLVSTKDIKGCAGGLIGEEITIDYRQALSLQIGVKKCHGIATAIIGGAVIGGVASTWDQKNRLEVLNLLQTHRQQQVQRQ